MHNALSKSGSGHSLAPLSEDSEHRMSTSDAEILPQDRSGLSPREVATALKHLDELFPGSPSVHEDREGNVSAANTEPRSRDGSVFKDPLSRHNAFGRRRVDSTSRPIDRTFTSDDGKCGVFHKEEFDEHSFHGHRIDSIALRGRLDSKALDWSTIGRVQSDFATHDKLSENELQTLQEKVDRAHTLHRANSIADAAKLYEEVLLIDPLDWDCLSNLAKIAFSEGNYEKAKELFERAVAVRPERDKTVYYLGHVLFKLRMLERAEAIFRQVSESYRNRTGGESTCDMTTYHETMAMLGLCLQFSGNFTEAQSAYDEVLKDDKDHVQTLCHVCALKSATGLATDAANEHSKVVALDPSHTKRVCPYLDSLFPADSEMLHEIQDLGVRWDNAPKGKVPNKSLLRTVAKKLSKALRAIKGKD